MSNILRYSDNGKEVVIRLDGDPGEIDALAKRFDEAAAAEEAMRMRRCTDDMLDKLIGWDAQWAATPMEDAMGLADELHEVTRDAQEEIDRLNRRCNGLIFGGLCIASGCFVTGLLLGGWLL